MRVIGGTHKGQRLVAPKGAIVRPTSDRVREAVFSILRSVEGARVLDLYAGSGALGIEALSRGAGDATFVDSNARAAAVVRTNLGKLGLAQARVMRASVPSFLRRASAEGERWDLVLCDPPYRLASRLSGELGILLPPVLAPGARIVCESARRDPLTLELELMTERAYGDTVVRIYAHA